MHVRGKTLLDLQCALLANSAGVGGGPFYVPLLNVVVGFSLKDCTGLSHTIVATSAVASTLYGKRHFYIAHVSCGSIALHGAVQGIVLLLAVFMLMFLQC